MIEGILSIRVPEWIHEFAERFSVRIRFLDCVSQGGGGARDLVEIQAPQGNLEEALEALKNLPYLREVDITPTGKDRALVSLSTTCPVCTALAGSSCFLISSTVKEKKIQWTLLTSSREKIVDLVDRLKRNHFEVEIVKMAELRSRKDLTLRQEEILQIALEKGYFDYPKRTSIRELSRLFGVSISTLSEILRTGQKKVLASYFEGKGSHP
jgi:predicted DNA binding protein